jgi:aminoglycoside phosphotransferase (APT) family kinase protein
MTATTHTPLTFDPQAARSTLLTMAETMRKAVAPALEGDCADRVAECVDLMLRLAQEVAPGEGACDALSRLNATPVNGGQLAPLEIARLEAAVLAEADAELAAVEQNMRARGLIDRAFDASALEHYLRAHPRGGTGVRIGEARLLSGGRSKITVLVRQRGAVDLPAEFIVRQDWSQGVPGTSVKTEFALIEGLFRAGVKVPEPLLLEPGTVLGTPFLVTTRVPGNQHGDYFNPPRCEAVALAVAGELGRIHSLAVAPFVEAGVRRGASTPAQMLTALAGFREAHERCGVPARTVDLALDWLESQCMRVDTSRQAVVHNDLGAHNLMLEDDTLTAILDWELAAIDHPAADLAFVKEWISLIIPWDRFLERYRQAGGAEIDRLERDFYALWVAVRTYVMFINFRVAIGKGELREFHSVYSVMDYLPRILRRMSGELCEALEHHPA